MKDIQQYTRKEVRSSATLPGFYGFMHFFRAFSAGFLVIIGMLCSKAEARRMSRKDAIKKGPEPLIAAEFKGDLDDKPPMERLVLDSGGTLSLFSGKRPAGEFSLVEKLDPELTEEMSLTAESRVVEGNLIVHIRAHSPRSKRVLEGLLHGPSIRRMNLAWSGYTGPQGRDSEYEVNLDVGKRWILAYQSVNHLRRCDGKPARFFMRALDYKTGVMRPVTPVPDTRGLEVLTARNETPGELSASAGLAPLSAVFGSTSLGDGELITNIARPGALDDGDVSTAWIEGKGGFGLGEFIDFRGAESPYKIVGMRIIPGHGASIRAFRDHNRIKSIVVSFGEKESYLINVPMDPLGALEGDASRIREKEDEAGDGQDEGEPVGRRATHWVIFPRPIAARCATVLINSVYSGKQGGKWGEGGRTALSELRFLSELDLKGGIERLLSDVENGLVSGDVAFSMLRGISGDQAGRIRKAMKGLGGAGRSVAVRALLALDPEGSMKILMRILPELSESLQDRILETAVARGDSALLHIRNLLVMRGISVDLKLKVLDGLLSVGTRRAAEILLSELGKGARQYRGAVVETVGKFSPGVFVPKDFLVPMKDAAESGIADRIWAAGLIAPHSKSNRSEVATSVIQHWNSGKGGFEFRMRLIQAMGRCLHPVAKDVFEEAGRIEIADEREVEGVKHGAEEEIWKILKQVSTEEEEELLRWGAVRAIGESGLKEGRKVLLRAVKDTDPRVRVEALGHLAAADDPLTDKFALFCALQDPWSWARVRCLQIVAARCPPEGEKHLLSALRLGTGPSEGALLYPIAVCRYPAARGLLNEMVSGHRKKPGSASLAARLLFGFGDWDSAEIILNAAVSVVGETQPHTTQERLFIDLVDALKVFLESGVSVKQTDEPGHHIDERADLKSVKPPAKLVKGVISLSKKVLEVSGNQSTPRSERLKLAVVRLVSALCPCPDASEVLGSWAARRDSRQVRLTAIRALEMCKRLRESSDGSKQ